MKSSLENKKFEQLTVIKQAGRTANGSILWECECSCGSKTFASTSDLLNGHKKSCGCLKHISHAEDLKGQRFGYLIVKKRVGTSKDRRALWKCKCDCGRFTVVRAIDLKSGNTKSCGCLGAAYAKRNLRKDI
jgi:hypothetical protein